MTNQELARRADIALADLNANGGLLTPDQANTFIDMVQEQPTILAKVRTVRMRAPQMKINRIGFATRILRAARQVGGSLDAGGNDRYVRAADRAKPTTAQIELNTSEVIAEVHIPYELLEDNIEGASFESHVMRLIAERAALDFEEWALWSDTGSGDPFLALQDGYIKRMVSHIVDNANAGVGPDLFLNSLLAIPQKYLRNVSQMSFFLSKANELRYRDLISKRIGGMGDAALNGNVSLSPYGVPLVVADLLGSVGNGSKGFFTYPQNLLFGIQRTIQVETDKDIRSREIIIVLTARSALQIDDIDATVKIINI
jgi:hypothetical protein